MLTADELEAEGRRLHGLGHRVMFLYPTQERMAVETQSPFLRYERLPEMPHPDPAGQ